MDTQVSHWRKQAANLFPYSSNDSAIGVDTILEHMALILPNFPPKRSNKHYITVIASPNDLLMVLTLTHISA